ncbi:MAG: SLC13 family permease [Gammaproteobacteria bacterium]
MLSDTTLVFGLIGIAAIMMASNRVRYDVVALLVVVALILSGLLSVGAALSGFGSPVVIVIAGLLIIGEMLDRTGIARAVGDWILRRGGKSEIQLLILIMLSAGILGSVMSSTAIMALFTPIVLRIARETGMAASRILIPTSYAALISGMMTLIASSPNLVVNGELVSAGLESLDFFSFTPIGLAVLGVAVAYIVVVGRHLLPGEKADANAAPQTRTLEELWLHFEVGGFQVFKITSGSPLASLPFGEAALESEYGVRVLSRIRRERGHESILLPSASMEFKPGDLVSISGSPERVERLAAEQKLTRYGVSQKENQRWIWETGLADVLIHPDSNLIGKSVIDSEFRTRYGLLAIGLRRDGAAVADFEHSELQAGDVLLLYGPWDRIDALVEYNHDFVVLEIPPERGEVVAAYEKAPIALAILGAMVLLTAFEIVPLVVSVLCAAMAAVLTGCLSAQQAYRSISWSSLVLVAGMLPLADALQQTGGSALIVEGLIGAFGDAGPNVMLTVLFALTALLGMVLSNTASAVLVVPIAITAADTLQVSPYPFAIAVLIAASAAYSTPVSTPVVTLVVEPGRYNFMDFVKVGVPLLVLTCLTTLLLTPLLFPY